MLHLDEAAALEAAKAHFLKVRYFYQLGFGEQHLRRLPGAAEGVM